MSYVDDIVSSAVSGLARVSGADYADLERVGAEAAEMAVTRVLQARGAANGNGIPAPLPSPDFYRSGRYVRRRAALGFPSSTIPANTALMVATQQVSRVFHPDRLLVVPAAPGLVIDSLLVGDEEQMITAAAPVELYGTQALTDRLPDNFTPVQTGTTVRITLRNTTGADIDVTAGMKGGVER